MLGSGTELVVRFRLFPSVRYCVLAGAVWCGAVHTFSHTQETTSWWRNDLLPFTIIEYIITTGQTGGMTQLPATKNPKTSTLCRVQGVKSVLK